MEIGAHTIFNSSGKGSGLNALFEAYGKSIAEQMMPFELGFLSPPSLNRNNRAQDHFYINGRPVHSRELSQLVDEAYFSFMPAHRYPIVFLLLSLSPDSVDVNVHPGKLEVKFRDFSSLRGRILASMHLALGRSNARAPEIIAKQPATQYMQLQTNDEMTAEKAFTASESISNLDQGLNQILYHQAAEDEKSRPYNEVANIQPASPSLVQDSLFASQESQEEPAAARLVYSSLTPLGQFAGTFIICSSGDYLYIIDQHAAAERIMYERIAAQAENNPDASSQLAIPVAVELSHREALTLTDAILDLRDYGFIVESFGDNSFVIRGVPLWYTGDDPEQLLRLFLDEITDNTVNVIRMRKQELFMAACKQAIKANSYLSPSDISALFEQLDACENSSTCPHGRPLAIRISRAEIYKRFLRGSI